MTSIILSRRIPGNAVDLVVAFLPQPRDDECCDPACIVLRDVGLKHIRSKGGNAHFSVHDDELLSDPRLHDLYTVADTPFKYTLTSCYPKVATDGWARYKREGRYRCDLELRKWRERTQTETPEYRCVILQQAYLGKVRKRMAP